MTATHQPAAPTVPGWITDPDLIQSILDGFVEIPDELNPQEAS
ncbi:hypothetical protein ACN2WE_05460 [Streptomyces sp. cg28]